ncbi:hypothetical protein TWF970_000275 [Orbilia oligospora]|uniref:Zn(2)-C6 fungal-type domain-containing protein n=2 Tax=Orbilia oligospora TaxID=2813651 RepID=A0A7C8VHG6_ORBOL|nr:hypothetical protein TWF970_000275 [Orbilia oligospora]
MLSTGIPHHSYIGAPTLLNGHTSTIESLSSNGLSSYSFSHHPKSMMNKRHHPYGSPSPGGLQPLGHLGSGSPTTGPIRRRISRACDQCNQLRTRCDGKMPCQHCIDFNLDCKYNRERKKRGKASRKDIQNAQAAAAAAAAATSTPTAGGSVEENGESQTPVAMMPTSASRESFSELPPPPRPDLGFPRPNRSSVGSTHTASSDQSDFSPSQMQQQHHHHRLPSQHHHHLPTPDSPTHMAHISDQSFAQVPYGRMPQYQPQQNGLMSGARMLPHPQLQTHAAQPMPNQSYGHDFMMISPQHQAGPQGGLSLSSAGISPLAGLLGQSPDNQSPGWLSLPSPPTPMHSNPNHLRYPVLLPILPHLQQIIPTHLACELLDLFFLNPILSFFQPASPYVLCHVLRKKSVLHPTHPRLTTPALLASMLWIAAQTSDAPALTVSPSARGRICQKLLEMCIGFLRPLVHIPLGSVAVGSSHSSHENENAGMGLGGLASPGPTGREGVVGAAGTVDDILTYIHLATVISASEFKGASLRWWNAAWALARELRLNREVSDQPELEQEEGVVPNTRSTIGEEEKEERRRIWWLLYIVDRHLALCYNRPLALRDIECVDLLQPMDDTRWQNGDFYGSHENSNGQDLADPFHSLNQVPNIYASNPSPPPSISSNPQQANRCAGPTIQVTGPSLFGFFLPLMTILGEIVDLHHARNHPRLGQGFGGSGADWEDQVAEIQSQLDMYERSLSDWEHNRLDTDQEKPRDDAVNMNGQQQAAETLPETTEARLQGNNGDTLTDPAIAPPPAPAADKSSSPLSGDQMQKKIALAYGTHVLHVLHILLSGKWDPISMLDDNDLWISSPGFISATAHAVSAAEAIGNILKYDPDLSFMPYFFGIYLLQGSFLLLLIADKLQGEASQAVVGACETIVRAHEVCVVTLNTEYQRNFRKVMRSALAQVRGRCLPEDMEEQKQRRREVLMLYRWCGDGHGLAL